MLYLPGKFLFIHIPRTGGNAITRTLATALLPTHSPLVCLGAGPVPALDRHARAVDLRELLPDFDDVTKVAVYRSYDDIVRSDYELHRASTARTATQCWRKSCELARSETVEEFRERRWHSWIGDATPWQHWCCDANGMEQGVNPIPYSELDKHWHALCRYVGIKSPPELLRHDFQKLQCSGEVKRFE